MSDGTIEEGGCLCGAVRYRITGPVGDAVHCHCTMCRRSSGAVVVTWITVPPERFAFTRGGPVAYRSSAKGTRRFCGGCGTQLTFVSEDRPEDVDVTVGSLDHPENHPADRNIWTSVAVPWLRLDEHLPSHPGFTSDDAQS